MRWIRGGGSSSGGGGGGGARGVDGWVDISIKAFGWAARLKRQAIAPSRGLALQLCLHEATSL